MILMKEGEEDYDGRVDGDRKDKDDGNTSTSMRKKKHDIRGFQSHKEKKGRVFCSADPITLHIPSV